MTDSIARPTISLEVARHTLGFLGDPNYGLDGGFFFNQLMRLIDAGDAVNREKLRNEFPQEVHALLSARRLGVEFLRAIVKADLDGRERGLDFAAVDVPGFEGTVDALGELGVKVATS
ncbi:MAG: hypothetical protein J0I43_01730 [Microbacterium sp.]|uniref:hypothetical protein n=1 Tax=Microbacterium sp. TaxID=51671 RepID=UPI001AD0961D|nr:hypothetical protein [Microbacterium sp.]MBN9176078.1 hypothetical protein [Microbacterium sp.]